MKRSNRSTGVAKRLGLKSLTPKPPFMSLLSYSAYRIGGKNKFIDIARYAEDENVSRIILLWDRLSNSDKRYISLDDLCKAIGVDESEILAEVRTTAYFAGLLKEYEIMFRAIFERITMIETSVRRALTKDGYKDREKLYRSIGVMAKG